MEIRLLMAAFALAIWASPSAALAQSALPAALDEITAKALVGDWVGTLQRSGTKADIGIHFKQSKGGLQGTFDWPDLGYLKAPILNTKSDKDGVRISLPLPLGALRLIGPVEKGKLVGRLEETTMRAKDWITLPADGSFTLRRGSTPKLPYSVRPVSFFNDDVELSGEVYLPRSPGKHAGVIFVHGSGDSDRSDGAFFADRLARKGITCLVYDKRGVRASKGNWRTGSYEALAGDAHAALLSLRKVPNIDVNRVGYIGRSEGGWVVPLAVELGGANFVGMVSGPTVSVADEDIDDYRNALTDAGISSEDQAKAFALVRLRQLVIAGHEKQDVLEQAIERAKTATWFPILHWEGAEDDKTLIFRAQTIEFDPERHLRRLGVPSLWIYGSDDRIIPVAASVSRLITLKIEPRPVIVVLPKADHALAVVDYPKLPSGVARASGLLADWIARLPSH